MTYKHTEVIELTKDGWRELFGDERDNRPNRPYRPECSLCSKPWNDSDLRPLLDPWTAAGIRVCPVCRRHGTTTVAEIFEILGPDPEVRT